MKIAFDNQIFNMQKYGGISRYITELTRHINFSKDSEAKIFAGLYINNYLIHLPSSYIIGIKFISIKKTTKILLQINKLLCALAFKVFNADIYHHTYYYGKKKSGAINVVTVYDMIHEIFPNDFGKNDKTSQNKSYCVGFCDHVICISESTKRDLISILKVPENKISVIYLGFHEPYKKYNDTVPDVIASKPPFILYVGDRGGYKNFTNFVNAFAASQRLVNNFIIVAFGGKEFTVNEVDSFKRLGLINKIFNIQGNDKLLSSLYFHASLFVYPSLYEGFGIPPLEAMSHECPVVCSNTSSIPEVVGNAAILFDPHSVNDMRHSIEKVAFDDNLKNVLIKKGNEQVKRFSWQKCADETLAVYRSLLSK